MPVSAILSSVRRNAAFGIAFLALGATVAAAFATTRSQSAAPHHNVSVALVDRISATDAVVVAHLRDSRQGPHETVLTDVTVLSVVYQSDAPATTPRIAEGDLLTIADRPEFGSYSLTQPIDTEVVLLVTYHGTDSFDPELVGYWQPDVVAVSTADGLEFSGPAASSGHYQSEFVSLYQFLTSSETDVVQFVGASGDAEVALLASWVQELRAGAGLNGPITRAFLSPERRQVGRDAAWYEQPTSTRWLGPGLAPAEVMERMTELSLIIDVDVDARAEDLYVVVRTATGVSHVGALSGGSQVASVFSSETETLEFLITTNLDSLDGVFFAEVGQPARPGADEFLVVSIRGSLLDQIFDGAENNRVHPEYDAVDVLDREAFQALIADFAEANAGIDTTPSDERP